MGWYLYLPRSHKDGSNQKGHDTIDIYAHDVAAIVAYKNTPDFEALNDTFERLEAGYRNDESTEEVSLT
jgi:hypothetical protein